jgi:ribonuclease BN (tRNA processing enzyme)
MGHIDPREAARIALGAEASKLLLTHVPASYGIETALADARDIFPSCLHAHSGLTCPIGR